MNSRSRGAADRKAVDARPPRGEARRNPLDRTSRISVRTDAGLAEFQDAPGRIQQVARDMMQVDLVALAHRSIGEPRRGRVYPSMASLFPSYAGVPATWMTHYYVPARPDLPPERGCSVHGEISEAR